VANWARRCGASVSDSLVDSLVAGMAALRATAFVGA
jgi:hypothetical protein